ncbi:Hypothetical predicted protein [Olea europaea subsp. europaea]|uniref:Uncharacterized protein n=1 Tax=Olea europaea subsp. europaea TaxID=158383 RepID=A0A8S0PL88_OLEEU|nr:Hypothetical predicted protein [Olea europaea subsp. europaea]
MRAISWQNTAMQELLGRMQSQLADSSQNNEEGVPLERENMVANYTTHQATREIAAPPKYSRAIMLRRSASIFDRLGPTRKMQDRPYILPAQARFPLIPLSQPHLFDPPLLGGQLRLTTRGERYKPKKMHLQKTAILGKAPLQKEALRHITVDLTT